MLFNHVTRNISAYCHGELSAEESRAFTEHIMACARCRAKFEEIKIGIKFAEALPQLSAPETLWGDLEPHLEAPLKQASGRYFVPAWQIRIAIAAAVLLFIGLGLWSLRNEERPISNVPSWKVQRIKGTPKIGTASIEKNGQLEVGQWLETDDNSQAQIAVSSIGQVEVEPNTRIRLLQTQPTEHRLELARGKLSARIWAPPRLFFVDTPSAVAADLGCAYTLEVDDAGSSLLRVTSGWVALELKDRESMVPAGAACETRHGVGPGTPYFEDAAPEFRQSLRKIDFDQDPSSRKSAMDLMLKQTRSRDTLTLWHLLGRVEIEERIRVYDKMASLVPPPKGVTRDGLLKLDPAMLDLWREELEPFWAVHTSIPKKVAEAYWRFKHEIGRRVYK